MNKIILNVDDFGLTKGVNEAVLELHKQGVVNSTTALVNSPYFKQGVEAANDSPNLAIGIHLTIDLFTAELYHPSLCTVEMQFHTAKTHDLKRSLDSNVVYNEWKAQIEKFIKITGRKPSHIDSHHHVHIFNFDANIAVRKLAEEYNLPVREFETKTYRSKCNGDFYGDKLSLEQLQASIEALIETGADYQDVMMHPAFIDEELLNISSYNNQRKLEFDILSSRDFKQYIVENNILISSYNHTK
ncbi:ChbG/HpnK family deacetylase [Mollicutes bacterium LVI A0039]|nr:ChbG/HpnK family deacetylase [Mollicutes bacterium LVI A0039]